MGLFVKLAIAGIILAPIIAGVVAHHLEERHYVANAEGFGYFATVVACGIVVYFCFDYLRDVYPNALPSRGMQLRDDGIAGFAVMIGIVGTTFSTAACYFIAWKWRKSRLGCNCSA